MTDIPLRLDALLDRMRRACTGAFAAIMGYSLCINLLMLTSSIYMMQVFDRVLVSRSGETLVMLTLIAFIALSTMAALDIIRTRIMQKVGGWLDDQISPVVLNMSVTVALGREGRKSPEKLRDLSEIKAFLSGPSAIPILDAPWMPVFIGFMFMLHPVLGWISVSGAVVLLALAILNDWVARYSSAAAAAASAKSMGFADAAIQRADIVEAMGMRAAVLARWNRLNQTALAAQNMSGGRAGFLTGLTKFFRQLLQIGILGIGAWLVIGGSLSPGGMIAASILMGRALAPVDQAVTTWRSARSAIDAWKRVRSLLEREVPDTTTTELPEPDGKITVEGVSFVHKGMDRPALRNVSFDVAAGETLAIIGPSAAGKSTLARLLVGIDTPHTGHVRLDGMEISRWNGEERGKYVGYLPQEIGLIGETVTDAISRLQDNNDNLVIGAARLAGVHETIMNLPKGYDMPIGPNGSALSGGERQRVALARAVYGGPRFILLDEPNSNLDAEGEKALQRAIDILKTCGTTVIVVAHRPSILRHIDKILVMQDGMVRMIGPRDEVLARVMPNDAAGDPARSDTIQPGDSEIAPQKPAQPAVDTAGADTAGESTVNPTAKGDVSFG
jgi:ATP-binding cassette subfamily C protein/ATP-binding cassette subfamily C protein EexD